MYTFTTSADDRACKDLIGEAFERAVREARIEGCPHCGKEFPILGDLELDTLWEAICKVLKVDI